MILKKLMAIIMASVLLLAGCSSGSKDAANKPGASGDDSGKATKEITVWAWDPKFNIAALEIAKEAYAKINPDVKINIVEYAQPDTIQKLNTGLNSGTTKGLPNIILMEDYRAQGFLQSYSDAFYDLSGVIKASDFADYKIGPTSYDGKQYGVPFDSGVTGLYYRTDYLEQAGYTAKDMENITWEKYIEIGKKVKEKTGKFMMSTDPNDLGILRVMMQSAGSWYMKEDGKTPFLAGNEALKESLEVYKQMMDEGIMTIHSDWSQMLAGFNSGNVASIVQGNWITPSVKAEASQAGKWAVAATPRLTKNPNATNSSNLGGSSWYVLNTDGADVAADFLAKTFGADVDFYQKLLTDVGAIGTFTPASSGPAYKSGDDYFGGQNITADFAEWTNAIPKVNYGIHTYAIEDIMKVELQNYLKGKDVDQVLNDAQKQAEAQLK